MSSRAIFPLEEGIESLAKRASALSATTKSFSSLMAPEPALLLSTYPF